MSPTQRAAMEDARNALQRAAYTTDRPEILGLCEQADDALRAALAEADEPVAWRVRASGATGTPGPWRIYQQSAKPGVNHPECCDFAPLYTHPPRREPLTEAGEPVADDVIAMVRRGES